MISSLFLRDMHNSLKRLVEAEKRMSTQKMYSRPSDNPSEVARGMKVGSLISQREQFVRNLDDAVTWLESTESALGQATDLVSSMREKAIYAGDGALSEVDRLGIAKDILAMRDELIQVANANIQGRYLFSGYETDRPAFVKDDTGKVVYQGDSGRISFEIEQGIEGTVSLNGRDVFPLSFERRKITSVEVPVDFAWEGSSERLAITVGDKTAEVFLPKRWNDTDSDSLADLTDYDGFVEPGENVKGYTLDEIASAINESEGAKKLVHASVEKDYLTGTQRLVIESLSGEPLRVTSVPWSDNDPRGQILTSNIVGAPWTASQPGSIDVIASDGSRYNVPVASGATLQDVAHALMNVPGIWAGVRDDGSITLAAEEGGSFSVEASGSAVELFGTARMSRETIDPKDINRMNLSSFLGLETSVKSTFFPDGAVLGDTTTDKMDMVISAGDKNLRLLVQDDSDLTLEELADRIKASAGDWLEVIIQSDATQKNVTDSSAQDLEGGTERLVLYAKDGSPVNIYDKEGNWSQRLGLSTANHSVDLTSVEFPPLGGSEVPVRVGVQIGDDLYEVKLHKDDVVGSDGLHIDPRLFAQEVQRQVGSGKMGFDLIDGDKGVAFYSLTGEPMRIYDLPYADPALNGITSGIAASAGLQTGIVGEWVSDSATAGVEGSFVIKTEGRSLEVSVGPSETLLDVAYKLKDMAGSWLNVGVTSDGAGNVRLSLSAMDGAPVSVYDNSGSPARTFLGISTDVRLSAGAWSGGGVLSVAVDGYGDVVDLRGASSLHDVSALVNARFGNGDIRAEVVDNGGVEELVFYSPTGKVFDVTPAAGMNAITATTSPRRGTSVGPYNQGMVKRTAANQQEGDLFALLDDLAKAVERGAIDAVSDSLLPKLDEAMDDLLRARALGGALQRRYETAKARIETDNIFFTEQYSNIMDVDVAEAAMEFQTSQMVYQATLATIAKVIQPTLVDYLS
jgi:flagellar hook-associated protein 3 FlgL